MIIPDVKKTASVIVARMKPGEGAPTSSQEVKPESELDPKDEGLRSTAEEIMQAFKDGSTHDLMVALKSFYAQCEGPQSED